MNYYRTIDADYVLIGQDTEILPLAGKIADSLRREGLRVGVLGLEPDTRISTEAVQLIAQAKAAGIVESCAEHDRIAWDLIQLMRQLAEEAEWPEPGRVPRIYTARLCPNSDASREEQIVSLVKSMHTYAPGYRVINVGEPPATHDKPRPRAAFA
jgi:hypothetical protein